MKPPRDGSPKRPGGKQRAAAQRDAERAAMRGPDHEQDWLAGYEKAAGPPPYGNPHRAYLWLANALLFAADATMKDPALPVEQRIQRLATIAPQLVKAADPARLGDHIDRLEEALARNHAAVGGRDLASDEDLP